MMAEKWFDPRVSEFDTFSMQVRAAMRSLNITQTHIAKSVGISQPLLSRFLCGKLRYQRRLNESLWSRLITTGKMVNVEPPILPEWKADPVTVDRPQSVAANVPTRKVEKWGAPQMTVLEMVQSGEVAPKAALKLLALLSAPPKT